MLEHKEELGFVISMFKVAITKYGFTLNQEQQKYPIAGVTQGSARSEGGRQRDPFQANNNQSLFTGLCLCTAHPASLLAFPGYPDLGRSASKRPQKEEFVLTDAWQRGDGRWALLNPHLCIGGSSGELFSVSV